MPTKKSKLITAKLEAGRKARSAALYKNDPESHTTLLDSISSALGEAVSRIATLKEGLQSWLDSIPEWQKPQIIDNFTQFSEAEEVQNAIDELETLEETLTYLDADPFDTLRASVENKVKAKALTSKPGITERELQKFFSSTEEISRHYDTALEGDEFTTGAEVVS